MKRGYQKKLILEAKKEKSWKELGKILDLNSHYLATELQEEKRLISEEDFNKLNSMSKVDYRKFIKEKIPNNWGQIKAGKLSGKKPKIITKKKTEEMAELIGIMLGDGNIWVKEPGFYTIRIAGDKRRDKEYLEGHVSQLFKKLLGIEVNSYYYKTSNCMHIYSGSKDSVFTLKYFGLKPGSKIKNNVEIPKWIFKNNKYLKACIRGLIDTDGSVCPITGRNYNYIWFTSKIPALRDSFDEAMKQLDIKTSKWNHKKNGSPEIFIGAKDQIEKYIREVSFKNGKHLSKLKPR